LVLGRISDDAAFAHFTLANFKLGFDQRDDESTRIQQRNNRRQDFGG
jgi:hypothetical protein